MRHPKCEVKIVFYWVHPDKSRPGRGLSAPPKKRMVGHDSDDIEPIRCDHFLIVCQKCGRKGDLAIESRNSVDWDYWLSGFMAMVKQTGAEDGSVECLNCASTNVTISFAGSEQFEKRSKLLDRLDHKPE